MGQKRIKANSDHPFLIKEGEEITRTSMTWEEINNDFDILTEYMKYVASVLYLNADIELTSLENKRNFINDPYYRNYNRFAPVLIHKIKTFEEWKK